MDASVSFRAIGIELGKDPTTIAKEVKKHRVFQGHNKFNEKPYRCANARDCHKKNVCSTVLFCRRECRNCNKCHRLTQEDVNLMMSHINSANRESLGGLTPFKLAKLMLPEKLSKHFGLKEVPGDEVILTPALLKGKIEL